MKMSGRPVVIEAKCSAGISERLTAGGRPDDQTDAAKSAPSWTSSLPSRRPAPDRAWKLTPCLATRTTRFGKEILSWMHISASFPNHERLSSG